MVQNLDPTEIFSTMVVSSAFEPRSASIEEKRLIFEKFWAGDSVRLRSNFDSAGIDPLTRDFGFGFMVECFARHSMRLPLKNTEAGEAVASSILSAFHLGRQNRHGSLVRFQSRLANSDFLWVKQVGRLITVVGIGEVKSSYAAASYKVGGQLKRQEKSLEILVEKIKLTKSQGRAHEFFRARKVVVSEDLERILIVPFGEGEKARHDAEFSNWQIVELEFSYDELVFIAQQLWPDFRTEVKVGPGKLANLDRIAINLGDWIKPRLDRIFFDSSEFGQDKPLPYYDLGLFFLATGKTPLLEDEVRWAAELAGNSFWPSVQACLNFLVNSNPQSRNDFSARESEIFGKFWNVIASKGEGLSREDLECFIYFIRSLRRQIKDLAYKQGQKRQLNELSESMTI